MDFNHLRCNSRLISWVSPPKKKKKVLELGKIICLSQSNIFDNALGVKKKNFHINQFAATISFSRQLSGPLIFEVHWSFFHLTKRIKGFIYGNHSWWSHCASWLFKNFFFFDNLQYINQKETDKARASSSQTEAKVAGRLLGLCELTWWQIKPNRIHWFGIVQVDLETNETIFIEGIMWVDLVTNEKARMLLILINIIIHFGVWTNGN